MVQDALTLKGRTVAITRPREQAEETGELIRKYGGEPFFIPSIEITATDDSPAVERFVSELAEEQIDYVVFMSVNGIKYLLSSAEHLGLKTQLTQSLGKTLTLAVGPKTAQELRSHHIPVALVPAKYTSEGILDCLMQQGVSGKTVYIPRTRGATPELANRLRGLGAKVQEVYVYKSGLPRNPELAGSFLQAMIGNRIDAIIFGSSLSARNLFQMLEKLASKERLRDMMNDRLTVVAIGPVTAASLSEMGLKVDVMPAKYLFEDALIELAHHWNAE